MKDDVPRNSIPVPSMERGEREKLQEKEGTWLRAPPTTAAKSHIYCRKSELVFLERRCGGKGEIARKE